LSCVIGHFVTSSFVNAAIGLDPQTGANSRIRHRMFVRRKSAAKMRISESYTQNQDCDETACCVVSANEDDDCSFFLLTVL